VTVANPFDVAARLADGRPAVDDVEEYVAACRRLGYQHPDLTTHTAQVRDWYSADDGLDLRALDSDHDALAAAASAAEDAARMQADLMAELDEAWSGRGATAAREFLWRSCQSATAVSAAVRAAADAVATLRDALWRAVDAKVLATEAVVSERRADWLAAAKTVTTGSGDVAAASEVIGLQVTPFVDVEVGAEWVAAMREAAAAVDAAYDAAIARIATPVAVFGVPGVLGPRGDRMAAENPPPTPAVTAGSQIVPASGQTMPTAAHTVPAAAAGSAAPSVPAAAPWSGAEAPMTAPPPPPLSPPPPPTMPSAGELGAGAPSLGSMGSAGSGLGGFGQQLADLIGGLVGSGGDLAGSGDLSDIGVPDDPDDLGESGDLGEDLDEPTDDEDPDEDEKTEEDDKTDGDEKTEEDEERAEPQEAEAVAADVAAEPPPTPEPAPTAPPEPPAVRELPDATAQPLAGDAEPTPCEIAADELPQVGE